MRPCFAWQEPARSRWVASFAPVIAQARPLHYLALGDSYTIGEAVPPCDRWPQELVRRLRKSGLTIEDPCIVAVTGWTTDELAGGMDEASLTPGWELVTLQIGVNNQYRGRPAAEYREQFTDLLARASWLADGDARHVIVVSIPDWGVTRFAHERQRDSAQIAEELDVFNAVALDETARAGACFIDITGISRRNSTLVATDGLHPSAAQYRLWTDAIAQAAQVALQPSR